MTRAFVGLYLAAIVAANLLFTRHPTWTVYIAFAAIGCDLVCRDRLHDAWRGHVLRNMAFLIAAGSVLTVALNTDSKRVALASFLAFGAASATDAVVYHLRRFEPWSYRSNESNLAAAAVDSALFVPIALAGILPANTLLLIAFSQFCAKVAGGYVWSLILRRRRLTILEEVPWRNVRRSQ